MGVRCMEQDEFYMKLALAEAKKAFVLGEIPEKSPTTSVPYEVDISKQPILTYFAK